MKQYKIREIIADVIGLIAYFIIGAIIYSIVTGYEAELLAPVV